MMPDLLKIVKEAKQMQNEFKQARENLAKSVVNGESGAGLVKIEMNGKYEVLNCSLDDSLLTQPKKIIEELIASAFTAAVKNINFLAEEQYAEFGDMVKIPLNL